MMKKNAFFTFCLACMPGAGQMYCGYMKRGLSIMASFFAIIGFSSTLNLTVFMVFLPVIWAYSFFDTWRIRNLLPIPDALCPDDYIIHVKDFTNNENLVALVKKRHTLFGCLCVALGLYVILNSFIQPLLYKIGLNWLADMFYSIPTFAVAVLIILLGIWLVKSPAKEEPVDSYTKFTGEEATHNDTPCLPE